MKIQNNAFKIIALWLGLLSPWHSAIAQVQSSGTIYYEYRDKIDQGMQIRALGEDLFGDSIDYEHGTTSFFVVDVTAATSARLPMRIGRVLNVRGSSTDWHVNQYPNGPYIFGLGWEADVPYIQNDGYVTDGWLKAGGRCSGGQFSPGVAAFSQVIVPAHNFFFGNDINIPGHGKERLLAPNVGTVMPANGGPYVGITKSRWRVSCLPTIKNGQGEGFVVTLPDGSKFYFDWMAFDDTGSLPIERATNGFYLRRFRLYASKAVDRFGQSMEYSYDPEFPHHLTQLKSSDGAVISLAYDTALGKVSQVSAGARVWNYAYQDGLLSTVTLPDGSAWHYSSFPHAVDGTTDADVDGDGFINKCVFTAGSRTSSLTPNPSDVHTFHIVHPSGALGDFSFRAIMFGYNNVPGGCWTGQDYIPKAFIGNAIFEKRISGTGVIPRSWEISYYPSWSYASECASCPSTASTVVSDSSGPTITYIFGNNYSVNAGRLLRKTTSGPDVFVDEQHDFISSAVGQPFQDALGTDPFQITSNPLLLKIRPENKTTIIMQGRSFVTSVGEFDAFARPIKRMKFSAPTP